ncbi:MAG: hypothetical protein JNK48_07925 [Bryobacterales bacterium]|nr:hypothetical protein [Bryobacterales bacterium]
MLPILVVVYFCVLAGDALLAHFAADDMMNMAAYHGLSAWELAFANLRFYSTFYRPLGGVYYASIFSFAGLNPLPYRIVVFVLLLLNIGLFYRFIRAITGSMPQAQGGVILCAYHHAMVVVYYFNSQIYDILCATFYYLAFTHYLRARSRGPLTASSITSVSVLYVLSLNAKEMAVTFPVFLLLHEAVFCRLRSLRPILVTASITAIFIAGKCLGPNPLIHMKDYRPVFSLDAFLHGHGSYIESMFYLDGGTLTPLETVLFWAVLLAYALLRRSRLILFCICWIILSPLPIVFIGRLGGPAMYVPLPGWMMLLTAIAADILGRFPPIPRNWQRAAAVVALITLGWHHYNGKRHVMPSIHRGQQLTWRTIQQVDNAGISLPKGARVLVLNDPFQDWDMVFILQLYYRDPTLHVDLARKMEPKPSAGQLREYDAVLQFEAGRLVAAPIRSVTLGSDPLAWLEALVESMPESPPL